MIDAIIRRYRQGRMRLLLTPPPQAEFAFVGVGMHSLQNLYPVLLAQGIRLRWIHSRTLSNAQAIAARFQNCKPTDKLEDILNDPAVKGIFLCVNAASQPEMALRCAASGKPLWVDKPAARNHPEFQKLKNASKAGVQVSHQRRWAPAYQKLASAAKQATDYHLSYKVGTYSEGDVLSELAIHPLDLAVQLFGEVKEAKAHRIGNPGNGALLATLQHKSGAVGQLEFRTDGSWNDCSESLRISTPKGFYDADNFRKITFTAAPGKILGLPREKVFGQDLTRQILFNANGFLPELNHNELVLAGFNDSILEFARKVADQSFRGNLAETEATFRLMDEIRKSF